MTFTIPQIIKRSTQRYSKVVNPLKKDDIHSMKIPKIFLASATSALLVFSGASSAAATQVSPSAIPATNSTVEKITQIDDSSFTYSGDWNTTSDESLFQGSQHHASSSGNTMTIRFTGTSFRFFSAVSPQGGRAGATLDGLWLGAADFYSPQSEVQQQILSKSGLKNKEHTLVIRSTGSSSKGSSGTEIGADRIDVTTPTTTLTPTTVPPTTVPPASKLRYPRPEGWQDLPVIEVAGTTTSNNLEILSCRGGSARVKFPSDRYVPPVLIDNCKDLVVIGGGIRAIPGSNVGGFAQRALYLRGMQGNVYLEGLDIDGAVNGAETDGIAGNGQSAVLTAQNIRVNGIRGTQDGNHADVFQTWGGWKEMHFDHWTGSSNYQGFKFQLANDFVMDSAEFSNINLTGLTSAQSGVNYPDEGGYLFWADPKGLFPITLQDFWVAPKGNRGIARTVWPTPSPKFSYPAIVSVDSISPKASWSSPMKISGAAREGTPPGGDFVPAGTVGPMYK